MTGHFDAQCPRCGTRFGWSGQHKKPPPCPRCGYRQTASEGDAAEIAAFQKFLRDRKAARAEREARDRAETPPESE